MFGTPRLNVPAWRDRRCVPPRRISLGQNSRWCASPTTWISAGWLAIAALITGPVPVASQPAVRLDLGKTIARLADPPDVGPGLIQPATAIPGLGFVVLDLSNLRLQLFAFDGRLLGVTGRSGSGPGEMREPVSISLVASDTVAVLDRALQRLSFIAVGPSGLRTARTVPLDHNPEDICRIGRRFVALGHDPATSQVLHAVTDDGKRGQGWGKPFFEEGDKRAQAIINDVASMGRVACMETAGIIVAPRLTGVVRLYDLAGRLRWQTSLTGYVPTRVRLVAGGGVLFGRQPGHTVTDLTIGLVPLRGDLILVQTGGVSKAHPGPGSDYERVTTHLLRISDGIEVGRFNDLPLILAAGDGKVLTAESNGLDHWIEIRPLTIRTTQPR
jgi:hypothetical protein